MQPTLPVSLFQIVHGQAVGFHCFIFVASNEIGRSALISIGNEFQIMEPKYLKEFLPLRTEFIESITRSGLDRKLMVLSLFTNNFFQNVSKNIMKSLVNFY